MLASTAVWSVNRKSIILFTAGRDVVLAPGIVFSVGQSWREIFIVPRLQESFALSRMDPLHDNLIPRSRHPLYKVVFVQ